MSSRIANVREHISLCYILPHSAHAVFSRACPSVLLNLGHLVDKCTVEKCLMAVYAALYWVRRPVVTDTGSCGLLSVQSTRALLFDMGLDTRCSSSVERIHVDGAPEPPEAKPLYYAALCSFRNSVDIFTHTYPTDVNAQGGSFGTALNAAFDKGEVEIALALLQHGADINALDIFGESSLYRAARDGNLALVKLLLEHQADVNVRTGNGRLITPLRKLGNWTFSGYCSSMGRI